MTAEHIPNHSIDPKTGMIESNAYLDAFNAPRKAMFLQALMARDFDMNATVKAFGISKETVYKHKKMDQVFAQQWAEMVQEYTDNLEWVSMSNAMNPKSVIERIFQLKALRPEKYEPEKRLNSNLNVQINFDGKAMNVIASRQEAVDTSEVINTVDLSAEFGVENDVESERPLTKEPPTPMQP